MKPSSPVPLLSGCLGMTLLRVTTVMVHESDAFEWRFGVFAARAELARLVLDDTFGELAAHLASILISMRDASETIAATQIGWEAVFAIAWTPLGRLTLGQVAADRAPWSTRILEARHTPTAWLPQCALSPFPHTAREFEALLAAIRVGDAFGITAARDIWVEAISPLAYASRVVDTMAATWFLLFANAGATTRQSVGARRQDASAFRFFKGTFLLTTIASHAQETIAAICDFALSSSRIARGFKVRFIGVVSLGNFKTRRTGVQNTWKGKKNM